MIIGLAGRRVDAESQTPARFPADERTIAGVRRRIHETLIELHATALVGSAAAGADLLALQEAGRLGLRRRIILPFAAERFRQTSVTDRPGNWGELYDAVLNEASRQGDVLIAEHTEDDRAYLAVNHLIVDNVLLLAAAAQQQPAAIRVWEGKSRGPGDLTEEFGSYAQSRGIRVYDVLTQ